VVGGTAPIMSAGAAPAPAGDWEANTFTPESTAAAPAAATPPTSTSSSAPQPAAAAAASVQAAAPAAPSLCAPPGTAAVAPGGAVAAPCSYSASTYWNDRYAQRQRNATSFDWFFSYAALRSLLRHALTLPALPALHVGCGNSDLSIGLGQDGTPVSRCGALRLVRGAGGEGVKGRGLGG